MINDVCFGLDVQGVKKGDGQVGRGTEKDEARGTGGRKEIQRKVLKGERKERVGGRKRVRRMNKREKRMKRGKRSGYREEGKTSRTRENKE